MAQALPDFENPFLRLLGISAADDGHVNMVIDKSMGTEAVQDFCALAGPHVGHWKLGFGTAAFCNVSDLKRKISVLREHRILVYPGGTMFEAHVVRNRLTEYLDFLEEFGFNAVEISDGSCEIDSADRLKAVQMAKDLGLNVVTEVGKKDPKHQLDPEICARQLEKDFAAGADYVVVEARESGHSVGIFNERGEVKQDYFAALLGGIPVTHEKRIVWEAPLKSQQVFLIEKLGPSVSLGNLRPDEVLAVEALRRGLRWETFGTR